MLWGKACERLKSLKLYTLAVLWGVLSWAAPREAFRPADLWLWRTASDIRITHDGTQVVYLREWEDGPRNTSYANLTRISADGRESRAITQGQWHDRSPRWSFDDQRIAWISDRDGQPKIWIASAAGAEPRAITGNDSRPSAFAWSPDGRSIAFLSAGQIWIVPSAGGDARRVSNRELEFRGDPVWMPDGQDIVCAEKSGEIFAVRTRDGATRQLTHSGNINQDPEPSPDGSKIAYTGASPKPFYKVRRLWVMNSDGSRARQLAGTLDRDVSHPQWSNDSRTVYFLADDRGATHVYLARNDGSVRQLTDRAERLDGLSLADNGRAVSVRSSATEGSAVFTFMTDAPAGGWTLTDENQGLLAARNWGAVEEVTFQSAGKPMQARLVKPFEFDPARRYPLLVEAADTPPRTLGTEFPLYAHIFAARGFVVMMVNPRGTPGFGEEFGDLLPTEVPNAPAEDLTKAVDSVLAKGYIDPKRVFVLAGVSAAWLLGHESRFAGIIARQPIVDWTTYPESARWISDLTLRQSHSPITYASSFQTRTLVLSEGKDAQSEQLYVELQKRRVDSAIERGAADPAARITQLEAEITFLLRQK
jgi:dipeptidyl aminopeptidase/acylaminoacyl peptidase